MAKTIMNRDYQLKVSVRASIDHITKSMCEDKGGEYKPKSLDLATELFLNEIDLRKSKKIAKQWFPLASIICIVNCILNLVNIIFIFRGQLNMPVTIFIAIFTVLTVRYGAKGVKKSLDYYGHMLKVSNRLLGQAKTYRAENANRDNYLATIGIIMFDIQKEYKPALEYLEKFQKMEDERNA